MSKEQMHFWYPILMVVTLRVIYQLKAWNIQIPYKWGGIWNIWIFFGVGLFNENIYFSRERSILKQLKDHIDLRFSYCLSNWTIEQNPFTYLHFGSDAQISGNDQAIVQRTPLLPGQKHYNVEVLSIWLNGEKLPIDPARLQVRGDSSGGFTIDAGTTITLLVPNAYNTVRNESKSSVSLFLLHSILYQ